MALKDATIKINNKTESGKTSSDGTLKLSSKYKIDSVLALEVSLQTYKTNTSSHKVIDNNGKDNEVTIILRQGKCR